MSQKSSTSTSATKRGNLEFLLEPPPALADPVVEAAKRLLGTKEDQAKRRDEWLKSERRIAWLAKRKELDDVWGETHALLAGRPWPPIPECEANGKILCAEDLMKENPELHAPIIHGLLRQGEILNLIAPPKTGKSWMVNDLALAVCTGRSWLGLFEVEKGDVLILDNELHAATSANRLPRVADARGIPREEWARTLSVCNLRGHLKDLHAMRAFFDDIPAGRFRVVILDAFYRFLPIGADENDNGGITALYNQLDYHAKRLGCAFILIHHTSKGQQGQKAVVDVGAGAGAQARATDTHLILRRHQEADAVVLEAVTRSWPPAEPKVLRWQFPVWNVAEDLDPARLEGDGKRDKADEQPDYDVPAYVERYLAPQPRSLAVVLDAAQRDGLTGRRAQALLDEAVAEGVAHRWDLGNRKVGYASTPQPVVVAQDPPAVAPEGPTTAERVAQALSARPEATAAELAEELGISKRWVNKILADQKEVGEIEKENE